MRSSAPRSATTSGTRSSAASPPRSPGTPRRAPSSRSSNELVERRSPMRVTLVFPGIALPGFDSFKKRPSVDANFIDHGLASVGAAAKAAGHAVGLIDLRALSGWEHFRSLVRSSDTPVWGITSWSLHYPDAVRAMRVIKEERPEAVIVLGGVHATINTRQVLNNALADHVVTKEGEVSFPRLLASLDAGEQPPRLIEGEPPDLDAIPWVDRDLFDVSGELLTPMVPRLPLPFITTNAGRGCPFKCNFCQPAERMVFGNKAKIRSAQNVVDELLHLRDRYGFRSWMAHDDLFFLNPKWMLEFCDRYQAAGLDQPFICQMRADMICRFEPVVQRMAEAGLAWAMIGFESGSQRILDLFEKGTTVEQNLRAAEICRQHGVKVWANIMFGAPSETKAEALETVRMVWKIGPEHFSPSFFTPTPGSGMFDVVERQDLAVVDDFRGSCRSPDEAKIRGVDYAWLTRAIALAAAGGPEGALATLAGAGA
ncbi:MAG: B12-binding domain-containing radical SAM protein [Deltaproteobacteria bacterium]|nr:MAG: B12-binding domain-containing radical SAM protein [Deltaproteobacteria bacterium]